MFSVEEGSSGSEMDDEITGDGSTTSLSRWVFDEKNDYDDDYDDDEDYDERQHLDSDEEEDDNVEQRLIRTSPAVDSFDVDALEIPGAQKNDIEDSSIGRKLVLALQTLGVVFGDIGTSPLYTFSVMFNRSPINDKEDVIGALSLVIYTLILLPLVKYVFFVLWANDDGEGGTFALYSLICRHANVSLIPNQLPSDARISGFGLKVPSPELERSLIIKEKLEASMVLKKLLLILVLAGTAMVIADAVVTPAMSVMSAIGGLKVGVGAIEQDQVLVISVSFLVILFSVQKYGASKLGLALGPALLLWFFCLAGIGIYNLAKYDSSVFRAFNPAHIYYFFKRNSVNAWYALGGCVLCATGSEAMFADLSYFSVHSIQLTFTLLVLPCLLLGYLGQAAYLSENFSHAGNAFFSSVPSFIFWPVFLISNIAALIASRAMTTATFTCIKQSIALGCFRNMQGTLSSRNSSMNSLPSPGVQQANGSFSSGRFSSNNLPVALAQLSHGNSHGHSGIPNRGGINVGNPGYSSNANGVGGSIPGILSTSAGLSGRNSVSNIGMSHLLANAGPRITSAMGNMVGGVNLGRTISSGGLSMPGLSSRLNMAANSGSGLNVQGQNRMLGGGLPQGSQVMSMLGNSYHAGGGQLSQNHVNNMMLSDHSNDSSLFDINNDFPQLTSRPGSASGSQGQLGSLRKQGLGVPIVQQHQEFSIQNEDFPALPGYKGGSSDYPMDLHQKEQLHDNAMSMMHSQSFSIPRSGGFNLGGTYPSHRTQQQPQHTSSGGLQGLGLRPLNSPNSVSGNGYDQLIQQYQQQQNQPQFPVQQMSSINQFRDSEIKSEADPFCLLGLLDVLNGTKPDLTSLALGIDLTTLGLDLNSTGKLYKTFASPWTNEPAKTEVEFTVPSCYYATPPPPLTRASFKRFSFELLFYTFYSMPKDEAQLYAADELYERGWFYHKEHKLWFFRVGEPMVRTALYERGTYECLDPNSFKTVRKEHCIVQYEHIEKRPSLLQH